MYGSAGAGGDGGRRREWRRAWGAAQQEIVTDSLEYSQNDIDALVAIAKANPNNQNLQDFIEREAYKDGSGNNINVSWNTENPRRITYFRLFTWDGTVTTVDLSPLTALQEVDIYNQENGGIEVLNLSTLSNLQELHLETIGLNWNDVIWPETPAADFHCWGYSTIEATGAVQSGNFSAHALSGTVIDLSAYLEFNGTKSVYKWYEDNGDQVEFTEKEAGKFLLEGNPGERYYCDITNSLCGSWTMRTPTIEISRSAKYYSPQDTLALRKLAEDNPQVPEFKKYVDEQGWIDNNLGSDIYGITTDWTDEAPYRLTQLRIDLPYASGRDSISNLDLSSFTELRHLYCEYYLNISELDLSNNAKLEYLHIFSKNLESIDVSMCPNLTTFEFDRSGEAIDHSPKLKSINLSGCVKLENFKLAHAHITSMDFSEFSQLRNVTINDCPEFEATNLESILNIETLSLSYTTQFGDYIQNLPSSITQLNLFATNYVLPPANRTENIITLFVPDSINSIDLAEFPKLQRLEMGSKTSLKYSECKNYREGVYFGGTSEIQLVSPSHPEDPNLFENGDTIDLSSEAIINGIESTFLWVNCKYNTIVEKEAIKPIKDKPGVFVLDSKEEKYGEYWCKIMNPQFCDVSENINYSGGWSLKTNTFRVNTTTPELFDQRDVQVLADIAESVSKNSEIGTWWSSNAWMSNEYYNGVRAIWNNETPKRIVELDLGGGFNHVINTIDFSALDRLESLTLWNFAQTKNIILPKETSALRVLSLPVCGFKSLIVSPYTNLECLEIEGSYNLTTCDISNNKKLKILRLDDTDLEAIETVAPDIAAQLTVYGVPNNIKTIDLNDFPALKQLYSGDSLRFSGVLNPRQMEPLDVLIGRGFYVGNNRGKYSSYGETVSFPEEMNIGGVASSITWNFRDPVKGENLPIEVSGDSYTIGDEIEPGVEITATIKNSLFPVWELQARTIVYTCDGDANLDKFVNVADVTATVSYILQDQANMIERFGFAEADVNYDDKVEVSDIIGIVNIIQGKPVTKASELRDTYQPTVLLELDDKGFLSMTSQVPVAGIQLEFTGATKEIPLLSDAAHLVQASTLNGDTLRTLGYSMDGKTIPAGKTVIMQLPAGVKLLKAVFSDAEANSLKAEGDIVPTGIESIQTADQIEAVLNYPNPFSGSTTFSYVLKEQAQSVAIQIFSTSGALVGTIEGLPASVGTNRYTTSVQLPGGIYYYRLLLDGKKASEANTMMIK